VCNHILYTPMRVTHLEQLHHISENRYMIK
jgi:hypothetical protein